MSVVQIQAWRVERGVSVGPARCIASSCATRSRGKKTGHATEQDRPDALSQRRHWVDTQLDLAPERLVSIDET